MGARRSGWQGRVGYMRGAVRESESGVTLLVTRSPDMADRLAQLLNGTALESETDARSPVPRYRAFQPHHRRDVTLVAADGFSTGRSTFGDGVIVTTRTPTSPDVLLRFSTGSIRR